MKKNLVLLALIVLSAFALFSCNSDERLIRVSNAIYLDVKTVVTDPAIMEDISPEKLEKLAELERTYLEAVSILKRMPKDEGALTMLVFCADELLIIVDDLDKYGKYRDVVTTIRISTKLLKNHMVGYQ
jgi:hypothetical protein